MQCQLEIVRYCANTSLGDKPASRYQEATLDMQPSHTGLSTVMKAHNSTAALIDFGHAAVQAAEKTHLSISS